LYSIISILKINNFSTIKYVLKKNFWISHIKHFIRYHYTTGENNMLIISNIPVWLYPAFEFLNSNAKQFIRYKLINITSVMMHSLKKMCLFLTNNIWNILHHHYETRIRFLNKVIRIYVIIDQNITVEYLLFNDSDF